MKKFFIPLFVFASCRSSDVVSISDASKDSVIQIKTKTTYPTTLQLHIQGRANDTFIINNILIPGGIVDTTIKYDWYKKDFPIDFKAYNVSTGSIIIKYKL